MSEHIIISKACFEDLEEILVLQKLAFLPEAKLYEDLYIEPLVQTLESIRADYNTSIFLKATHNNQIIGSVKGAATEHYCLLSRLIVAPEFQNQGIGRKLMLAIEKEFPQALRFLLYTGLKSTRNIRLYESLGYEQIEVFQDEDNHSLQWVTMAKRQEK